MLTQEENRIMLDVIEEVIGELRPGEVLRSEIDRERNEIIDSLEARGYTPHEAERIASDYLESIGGTL